MNGILITPHHIISSKRLYNNNTMSEMRVKFSQTFASNWRRFFFSSRSSFSFFFQILFLSVLFSAALFFIHSRSKVSLPSSSSTLPLHFDSSSSSFSFFFYVTYIFLFWNRVCNFKINKNILHMMLSENSLKVLWYHLIIWIYFVNRTSNIRGMEIGQI